MKLQIKPSDPVVLTRWVDVCYVYVFTVYALWGISSALVGLPTLNIYTPDVYQIVWSGCIGLLSTVAAFFASLVFFDTSWMSQITKKMIEFRAVLVASAFIVVYPILLIARVVNGEVAEVGPTAILSLSYLGFPVLRLFILRMRIRTLRAISGETNDPT